MIDIELEKFINEQKIDYKNALFCVTNADKLIIKRDSGISGFGMLRLWGNEKNKADLYIYVKNNKRNQGIGKEIYKELFGDNHITKLDFLSTRIEENHEVAINFFTKLDYVPWYTEIILECFMDKPLNTSIDMIKYNDIYFNQYVDGIRNSFYGLRKENDFEPYYCMEFSNKVRENLNKNKEKIYLLIKENELVGSIKIEENSIEDVFVTPNYQGMGYGKEIMCFAMNKAFQYGNIITIDAITWNKRALSLYYKLGFKEKSRINYMRLFL